MTSVNFFPTKQPQRVHVFACFFRIRDSRYIHADQCPDQNKFGSENNAGLLEEIDRTLDRSM